ncbi:MAG: DR2241 family protein [Halarchaeum sp.]
MRDAVAALLDAATDGVAFDGLVVENGTYGYRFETPDASERGLDTSDLADLAADDPYVANWHYWTETVGGGDTARRAFLRWLEGAAPHDADEGDDADAASDTRDEGGDAADDEVAVPARLDALRRGVTRTWGELRIRVTRGDGATRVYDVRHVDDAGRDDLETYRDPLDARELVKRDDDCRYRPLSTAPSLPHGWRFVDLTGDELVDLVDFVYPATVANWHRERRGELDVTHWRETAARQTGIYASVSDLPDEALAWAAEACCVDSQCLKRRAWDYDGETELDVPRGDGEFPCREPCSLFVAAAREFSRIESEAEETVTVTLTESERAQLERLLDAVADGDVDEVREADVDDGANRYRARYLRAKRGGLFD